MIGRSIISSNGRLTSLYIKRLKALNPNFKGEGDPARFGDTHERVAIIWFMVVFKWHLIYHVCFTIKNGIYTLLNFIWEKGFIYELGNEWVESMEWPKAPRFCEYKHRLVLRDLFLSQWPLIWLVKQSWQTKQNTQIQEWGVSKYQIRNRKTNQSKLSNRSDPGESH